MATQLGKLGIVAGSRIAFGSPPDGWDLLEQLPEGVTEVSSGAVDVLIRFVTAADQLAPCLPADAERIRPNGRLWVAWPRRAGGHVSDVTDTVVRAAALPLGIVDVKVAAIDDDWSGLAFCWRRSLR
jgi:hypothetical protein